MTPRAITIGIFAACFLSLLGLWSLTRVMPTSVTDPRTLFARLTARRATRVAVTLSWAWIGWHFLVTQPK